MLKRVIPGLLLAMIWCGDAQAVQLPSVKKLIQDHDANGDGKLEAGEVKGSSFARQFSRWDVDGDGYVNGSDIINFRAKFGIRADGSRIAGRPRSRRVPAARKPATRTSIHLLPVPTTGELKRVDSTTKLTRSERRNSAYVLKTEPHQVVGDRYVVLTDHNDRVFLDPLRRLVKHYDGVLLEVDDLATLHLDRSETKALFVKLQSSKPKNVAVAPRIKSLRENMFLHVW